ncbi:hypothetical protein BDF14DRAFT_1751778 [Spinellus fusiger]|nr:hypothetical protein BDF14DRAFT_1751778 [Spinellus fusiger]
MSLLSRSCPRIQGFSVALNTTSKRYAHKKASIQVKLNEYIEGLGLEGEVVSVRAGLMRNILYPANKATYIQVYKGTRNRQWEEEQLNQPTLTTQAPSLLSKRKESASLFKKMTQLSALTFKRAIIPGSINTFGSVTTDDVLLKLAEQEIQLDRQTVVLHSNSGRIKTLGEHLVTVTSGHQSVTLKVVVEAAH